MNFPFFSLSLVWFAGATPEISIYLPNKQTLLLTYRNTKKFFLVAEIAFFGTSFLANVLLS